MKIELLVTASLITLALGCAAAEKAGDDAMKQASESAQKETRAKTDEVKSAAGDEAKRAALQAAAAGEHRSEKNRARDSYRHPVETLMFFGVEPDDTVVEVWPGSGWYTEILAPYLVEGKLVAASYAPREDPEDYRSKTYRKFDERISTDPVFARVEHGMLQPGQKIDVGEPGSADYVLTFRNIHNFVRAGAQEELFETANRVLKDGGILGVVQHRADEGVTDVKASAETGYIPESYVIEMAEAHGFELVEKSEINANPRDTKDHPEGVWTLPPGLRLGEQDREKYMAIGESDRMTMKFEKVKDLDELSASEPSAELSD